MNPLEKVLDGVISQVKNLLKLARGLKSRSSSDNDYSINKDKLILALSTTWFRLYT